MARQHKRGISGSGSVYQRKSDGRWVASFIVEETGRRKYLYADKDNNTQQNAYKKLQDALFKQKQGRLATGPRQTVEQYLTTWLEEVHRPEVEEITYLNQSSLIKNHLIPAFGHLQLKSLTVQQVQRLYTSLINDGYKAGTIHVIHSILHKALDNAVKWKLVSYNVAGDVTLPRDHQGTEVARALTAEQALLLLKVSRGHSLEALIALALVTAMRHGEIMALRWRDVDLEGQQLSVKWTVAYVWGHGHIRGDPKSRASKRDIQLPGFVIDALVRQREQQEKQRLRAGDRWQENDLVFSNRYGKYLRADYTLIVFHKLLEQHGLPRIRIHDLRHTTSSLLQLVLKVPPKLVQELLGHSTLDMTMLIYTHVDVSQQREMMDTFDRFLREGLE